jgi:CheY-like chemotaxis protein
MSIAQNATQNLPFLRRYARALTGSQPVGDGFVRATLEAVVANPDLLALTAKPRVDLYKIFHEIWSKSNGSIVAADAASDSIEKNVQENLSAVTPMSRLALLLTTLEEFDAEQAGIIMSLDADKVRELAGDAIADIELAIATDVMIIEDEPLITLQLEALVTDMGHRVCGTPTTLTEAIESVSRHKPGLILADIQLADGSSGVDAVKQILDAITVPVIFITAFPERLLTGERPEPTYLITKPFLENTVKAAIGQAMFLGSTALPQTV